MRATVITPPPVMRKRPNKWRDLHAKALDDKREIVRQADLGATRAQLLAKFHPMSVTRALRDLPPDQDRSRTVAATIARMAELRRGVCLAESIRRYKLGWTRSPAVWSVLRDMLDHRENGRPLSLGAVADAARVPWRTLLLVMMRQGYERGIREDER
jgi:hypothetical protein